MNELVKNNAVEILPDSDRYKMRFKVRSQTSNQLYLISFDTAMKCFKCNCLGCIRHGTCKHLNAMGLFGRNNVTKAISKAKELGLL